MYYVEEGKREKRYGNRKKIYIIVIVTTTTIIIILSSETLYVLVDIYTLFIQIRKRCGPGRIRLPRRRRRRRRPHYVRTAKRFFSPAKLFFLPIYYRYTAATVYK